MLNIQLQGQAPEETIEETTRIWKANCLMLRFWINIMKNPGFFLDVPVPELGQLFSHLLQ